MMGDFQLRINDTKHEIQLPDDQIARLLLVNEDNEVYTGKCDMLFNFLYDYRWLQSSNW